jgi:hypothetical protein
MPLLDSTTDAPLNASMIDKLRIGRVAFVLAAVTLTGGCATKEKTLPPMRVARPAGSPEEVRKALPGSWVIDVAASAEVMARTQFVPRQTTVMRREGFAPPSRSSAFVTEPFDPKAYREACKYWADLLSKPDMRWRIVFKAGGTGEHFAIVETGTPPQATPFTWKLDGWLLTVTYPDGARFKSFETEAPSAVELSYPMQPLGDHLVMRRE